MAGNFEKLVKSTDIFISSQASGTTSVTLTSSNAAIESSTRYNVRVRAVDENDKKGHWSTYTQASGDTV